MGSNLQGYLMPESKRSAFLGAFSKIKQRILWKWESDTLPGQLSNVKFGKWLPQSDILSEYCYTCKAVGIPCMQDGTLGRGAVRHNTAVFVSVLLG